MSALLRAALLGAVTLQVGCSQLPLARDDQATVAEDHDVLIDVGANDDGVQRIVQGRSWTTGAQVVDRTHIRFTPEPNFAGTVRFRYMAVHEHEYSEAEVVVTVEPDLDMRRQELLVRD